MTLLSCVNAIDRRDGEQVHLPRGLAGSFADGPDGPRYMSKKSIGAVSGAAPRCAMCVKYS